MRRPVLVLLIFLAAAPAAPAATLTVTNLNEAFAGSLPQAVTWSCGKIGGRRRGGLSPGARRVDVLVDRDVPGKPACLPSKRPARRMELP